jgi:hypothetical protein
VLGGARASNMSRLGAQRLAGLLMGRPSWRPVL